MATSNEKDAAPVMSDSAPCLFLAEVTTPNSLKMGITMGGSYDDGPVGYRRIPRIFKFASWQSTTPFDDQFKEIGVGIGLDGQTLRIRLDLVSARHLSESLASAIKDYEDRLRYFGSYAERTGSQSTSSSDMPSPPVSGSSLE